MRNVKKWLAIGLAMTMMLGLVACGNSSTDGDDKNSLSEVKDTVATDSEETEEKEPVTLEWWYRGNGIQKDTELVETEFNKLLQTYPGMEHVTVHLNCYTGSEYANAVTLAQSAGQQIDILNSVSITFTDEVARGTYIALDDLLEDYEALYDALPEWLWNLGSVDNQIYMVPHYQRAANQMYMVMPKEYWDKYADQDAITAMCANPDRTVEEITEVLEDYVRAVQAGEGDTKYAETIGGTFTNSQYVFARFDTLSTDFVVYEDSDQVEYARIADRVKASYEVAARWYDEGLIPKDILSIDTSTMVYGNMLNPVSYCYCFQNGAGTGEEVSEQLSNQWGIEVVAIPTWNNYYIANSWGAGGDGITASCEHPEEAMRLLELMNTEE
ncbi:MAG: carbohydrate ABC transporter substrate-binding protein, partial [Roseburia sp.]|nr:carbohydrate ABC transporter substrate-binding protein [Roseburia sp.]